MIQTLLVGSNRIIADKENESAASPGMDVQTETGRKAKT
jgi:hypothetical protein